MKKKILTLGLLCSTILLLSACGGEQKESKATTHTTTSKVAKSYKTKELTQTDVEDIYNDMKLSSMLDKLGKPLKIWDNSFVYDEMNDSIDRKKIVMTLAGSKNTELYNKYKREVNNLESAKEISNLKLYQYTYYNDKYDKETALFWINPKTNKVVGIDKRSFIDEYGNEEEYTSDTSTTESSSDDSRELTAEEQDKNSYPDLDYLTLARNPEQYMFQKHKFSGTILQVLEGDEKTEYRLAVNGDYDNVLYMQIDNSRLSQRILEDDLVTVFGYTMGKISYEATSGATITIPSFSINMIDLNGHED